MKTTMTATTAVLSNLPEFAAQSHAVQFDGTFARAPEGGVAHSRAVIVDFTRPFFSTVADELAAASAPSTKCLA